MIKKFILMLLLIWAMLFQNAMSQELGDVQIHGMVSQGYLKSDHNDFLADTEDGTFEFNEMALNFSAPLSNKIRLGMQFLARDLGPKGNDELGLDWAYADYRFRDWLGLRCGRIRVVQGLYNEEREIDILRPTVFLPSSIYSELYRDVFSVTNGVSLYGGIPLDLAGRLSYQFQYGKLPMDANSGYAEASKVGLRGVDPSAEIEDMDSDPSITYGIEWETPLEGLKLGWTQRFIEGASIAVSVAPDGLLAQIYGQNFDYEMPVFEGWELSLEYTWNDLIIYGEYTEAKMEGEINGSPRPPQPNMGYYIGSAYRFLDWFQLGYYYSVFYPNSDYKDGRPNTKYDFLAWSKEHVTSLRFDITMNWLFKIEWHNVDGFGVYSPVPFDELERRWNLFAIKTSFMF